MQLKTFFTRWLQKMIVITVLLTSINKALAQANHWAVFGANGCSSSSKSHRMTTAITPVAGAFFDLPTQNDAWGIYYSPASVDYLKNSVFDKSGNLLFSVNQNGIYYPNHCCPTKRESGGWAELNPL